MSAYIPFLIIPLIFILFDILTGVIKALKNNELSSTKAREGLYHKTGFIILIIFGCFLNFSQTYFDIGVSIPALQSISIYICVTELISTLENLTKISPELEKFLKKYFNDKDGSTD